MKIGGLQKVSLIDYPGKIGAVIFTQGCNFRCPYCHNPELVDPPLYRELIPEELVFAYLEKRLGKLEAVTITGGEPAIQSDLGQFAKKIKAMGYLLKLDTNGSRPDVLAELIGTGLIDYVAMDIKAPLGKYRAVTRTPGSGKTIRQSIELIMASGIDYEFRTTIVRSQLTEADIQVMGNMISGATRYALQRYNPTKPLAMDFLNETTFSQEELASLRKRLEKKIKNVMIR